MPIPKIENKLAALKEEYEKKYSAELDNVKKDVVDIVENLTTILHSVAETGRKKVLKGVKVKKLLAVLGIDSPAKTSKGKSKSKKGKTAKPKLSEDAVKAFIGKGTKTKSELSAHFKGGNVKVVKLLNEMVKAGHLETSKSKSEKNKEITHYKVK